MRHTSATFIAVSVSLFAAFACGGVDHSLGKGPSTLDDSKAGNGGSGPTGSAGSGGTQTGSTGGGVATGGGPASGGSVGAGTGGGPVSSGGSAGSAGSDTCPPAAAGSPGGDFCGGIAGIACKAGYTCIDDPSDDCDAKCGGADCGGVCVRSTSEIPRCGGFVGLECPERTHCVDDVSDSCRPGAGGADCMGICIGWELAPSCEDSQCEGALVCADSFGCSTDSPCKWCAPNPDIGVSCDRSVVTCKRAEPQCPAGFVVSVVGSCFGPCVPIGLCSCDAKAECPAETQCNQAGRCFSY